MSNGGFTPKTQELLILGLKNGYISHRSQNIYTGKDFFHAVKYLKDHGVIEAACCVCEQPLNGEEKFVCENQDNQHRLRETKIASYTLTRYGNYLAMALRDLYLTRREMTIGFLK